MNKLPTTRELANLLNGFGRAKGGKGKVVHSVVDRGWDSYIGQLEIIEKEHPFVKVGVHVDAGDYQTKHRAEKRTKKNKDLMGPIRRKNFKDRAMVQVAQVAFWNEFGTKRIPERSFIRSTWDENTKKYEKIVERLMVLTFLGNQTVYSSLAILGLAIEADIKRKITTLRTPPNAASTIRRKKSSNPLIDTGQMRSSIRYVVGNKDSGG